MRRRYFVRDIVGGVVGGETCGGGGGVVWAGEWGRGVGVVGGGGGGVGGGGGGGGGGGLWVVGGCGWGKKNEKKKGVCWVLLFGFVSVCFWVFAVLFVFFGLAWGCFNIGGFFCLVCVVVLVLVFVLGLFVFSCFFFWCVCFFLVFLVGLCLFFFVVFCSPHPPFARNGPLTPQRRPTLTDHTAYVVSAAS